MGKISSPDEKTAAASAQANEQTSEVGGQQSETGTTSTTPVEPQKPPIKLQFAKLDPLKDERGRERVQSAVVEFANGDYYRKFDVKDQPFEITGVSHAVPADGKERVVVDMTAEEEAAMLIRSGHFVPASEQSAKSEEQSA